MGITKLMDFIRKKAPSIIHPVNFNTYQSKILTVDASNVIYQFLIKTQNMTLTQGMKDQPVKRVSYPTDWQGNKTGHLMGIMYRVLMFLQSNIQTIWVFDGPPPKEKYEELRRRRKIKQQAEEKLDAILNQEGYSNLLALKMSQRSIRITQNQRKQAIKMLKLIGLPVIEAPSQAQPQCAYLVKTKYSYGVVSEDMDTLAFGSDRIIRGLTKKNMQNIYDQNPSSFEINLRQLLNATQLTYDEFIDFCILCGCDYTPKIEKIGPINAYKLIKQLSNIENILQNIASNPKLRSKFSVPDDFNHLKARALFKNPPIKSLLQIYNQSQTQPISTIDFEAQNILKNQIFKPKPMQIDLLRQFFLEKQFSINRVENWINRITKAKNN